MSESTMSPKTAQLVGEVTGFVNQASGLSSLSTGDGTLKITQRVDSKTATFNMSDVTDVVHRFDADGKPFIQVNFASGLKILLTETLVGFKPEQVASLDMTKLPKVVTTPDLVSVLEAIEDTLSAEGLEDHELDVLKKVYQAILLGGETAGFELSTERTWLARLGPSRFGASA